MLYGNNSGGDLASLLASAPLRLDRMGYSVLPSVGAATPNFTRATTKTVVDSWGRMVTCLAGEVAFPGARRVRNLLSATEDFSSGSWTKDGVTASADTLTVSATTAEHRCYQLGATAPTACALGVEAKAGTANFICLHKGNTGLYAVFNVATGVVVSSVGCTGRIELKGDGWYRCFADTGINTSYLMISVGDTAAHAVPLVTWLGAGQTIQVRKAQLEDVTGQSVQTAGDYVSVGAICRDGDPNYAYIPNAADYVSTANNSAFYGTSTFSVRTKQVVTTYAPGTNVALVCNVWAKFGWRFDLSQTTGKLLFSWSTIANNGASLNKTATQTVANPSAFVAGNAISLRADLTYSSGDVSFYYSTDDGASWVLIQTVAGAGATDIYKTNTDPIELSTEQKGIKGASLKGYTGQIYADGVLKVDFNPNRDATTPTGTITSSTTGEVWTLSGATALVRNAAYHGAGVDGVKCFPTDLSGNPLTSMTTPLIELAATNICLQSNAFTTTWTNSSAAPTQNAVGPDGATSAWTLTDSSGVATAYIQQSITLTAAAYTYSVLIKKTAGATAFPLLQCTTGTTICSVTIDTNNGIATIWTSYTGFTPIGTATCTSYNANFWLVQATFTGTAAFWTFYIVPAGTTNATQSTGLPDVTAQGSAVFYGAQVELGPKATSYIPTTTIAVARNADQLYYTGALFANIKTVLTRGFKRDAGFTNSGITVALSDDTTNNYSQKFLSSGNSGFTGLSGGAAQWNQFDGSAYVPGQLSSAAWSMATNDIKMAKDGVAQTPDTSATVPTVSRIEYGMLAGASQLNGYPGKVYAWTRNLSQSELNAVTA